MIERDFSADDVQVLNRSRSHNGFIKIDTLTVSHRLHQGGWSDEIQRELILRPRAVGVLLFDPVLDQVVMVRQFRVGMVDEQADAWLLELVAGMVDGQEAFEEVARRESLEEANLSPADLVPISDYYNSPGTSNERVILFCGRVDASAAGGVFGLRHEHEDIAVIALPLLEALDLVDRGKINNAMSIIALQWLRLNKAALLSQWKVRR